MSATHFTLFLFTYCFVASCISITAWILTERRKRYLLIAAASVSGLILSCIIGSLVVVGENFVISMFKQLFAFSRTYVTAFGLGASCALPLALAWTNTRNGIALSLGYTFSVVGIAGTILFGGLSAGKEALSPYLPHPDSDVAGAGDMDGLVAKGFVLEEVLDTEIIPIRIAVSPDNKIFVSGHLGIAAQSGAVVELVQGKNGKFSEKKVAQMLNRPYGLIAANNHLLVSRSGQYAKWNHGKLEQFSTGAVTMLKDLDGDGVMDYYHDIVPDLPGGKGPDHLHQNNDLAYGPDGALYITTANHTDGNPPTHPWEGVILKASGENFENVEVFASGIRNAFGLTFNAEGELFATDNDPQSGILGGNMGDKILHVTEGAFFGHPFGHEGNAGVSPHALRSKFSLGGITLSTSDQLPKKYQDSLFVVVYGEGRIMQVKLKKENGQYVASLEPFAVIPGAADVAAAPNGDFYVAVYPDKVVRIRLADNAAGD